MVKQKLIANSLFQATCPPVTNFKSSSTTNMPTTIAVARGNSLINLFMFVIIYKRLVLPLLALIPNLGEKQSQV